MNTLDTITVASVGTRNMEWDRLTPSQKDKYRSDVRFIAGMLADECAAVREAAHEHAEPLDGYDLGCDDCADRLRAIADGRVV